jgi:hypothetical protein
MICEISGLCREVYENCALLGYDARVVVIHYRRFETTYHYSLLTAQKSVVLNHALF